MMKNKRVPFLTGDNFIYTYNPSGNSLIITVDINGAKGPNRYARDMFYLDYDPVGKVVKPYCHNATRAEMEAYCSPSNGNCCAAKIVEDGWTISEEYPWL